MKIKIAGIDNEIDLQDRGINILEIEDKILFKNIVINFNNDINYNLETKELILYDNDEQMSLNKRCNMYLDIFNIEFNSKDIINKLYDKIEKQIILEQSMDRKIINQMQTLKSSIESILLDLSFECDIKDEIQIKELLKILGIKLKVDYERKLEDKIFFLFDIISEFNLAEILVFTNFKQYFDDETLLEIYKYAIKNDLKIILIERSENDKLLKYEKKIFIDKEFDDFYYEL